MMMAILNHLFDFLVYIQASILLLFGVCLELSIFSFSNFLVHVFQIVSIWVYKLWVLILFIWFFWCMCTDFCQFQFQFLWCMCLFGSFNFCMYIRTLISLVYLLWFLWLWFIYVYKLWTLIFMCPISLVYVVHFLLLKLCGTLKLWNPIL
jgi:hypothetical protein